MILSAPATTLLLVPSAAAQQAAFDYPTFCDTSALSLNGDSGEGLCVLAVTDGRQDSTGSVWTHDTLTLGPHTVIRTEVALEIREAGPRRGSGMTFTLLSGEATALGNGAGQLGYGDLSPSLAVELDTIRTNEFDTIDGAHVGVNLNGSLVSIDAAPFDLRGLLWLWVEYHQRTELLEVWIAAESIQPDLPLLSTSVDLLGVLAPSPRAGFTGANTDDGYRERHLVNSWTLQVDDDSDGDGVMDFEDVCPGEDDTIDTDNDGVPDCLEDPEGPEDPEDPDPEDPVDTGEGPTSQPARDRAPEALAQEALTTGCGCGRSANPGWLAVLLVGLRTRRSRSSAGARRRACCVDRRGTECGCG